MFLPIACKFLLSFHKPSCLGIEWQGVKKNHLDINNPLKHLVDTVCSLLLVCANTFALIWLEQLTNMAVVFVQWTATSTGSVLLYLKQNKRIEPKNLSRNNSKTLKDRIQVSLVLVSWEWGGVVGHRARGRRGCVGQSKEWRTVVGRVMGFEGLERQ